MTGKLKRFLRGVRRLTPWHITELLFLVAAVFCVSFLWQSFKMEREHTATVQVWVPNNAASIHNLLGGLELRSGYTASVVWKDTHTLGEYQKLDAAANFVALVDDQIKHLAVLRNADGTVSIARTTVSLGLPGRGIREMQTVSFDRATGKVTAQYSRNLAMVITLGLLAPFVAWLVASLLIAYARRFKWNEPVFPLKCASV